MELDFLISFGVLYFVFRKLNCDARERKYWLTFRNSEFTSLTVLNSALERRLPHCAARCFMDTKCLSFAYSKTMRHCETYPKCPDKVSDVSTSRNGWSIYCIASSTFPQNCNEVKQNGETQSGVYTIYITPTLVTEVYCEMVIAGGGWTVFQKRVDGSVDFNKKWTEYKSGFGNSSGEYWLGNDVIHLLSHQHENTSLYIYMEDWNNQVKSDLYTEFRIADETDKYRLHVVYAGGTANFSCLTSANEFTHHGMQFSTFDSDNDQYSQSCAVIAKGAWWYNKCLTSNLNGQYLGSSVTNDFTSDSCKGFTHDYRPLKTVFMMLK